MSKHKIKKTISIILSIALISTIIPCGATNLVPFNGVKPIVTPSVPVTNSTIEQKNSTNEFSIQSIKSKVKDIVKPQKNKTKLQETYSGSCGDNVTWGLDTSTGVLNISGTGKMSDFVYDNPGWYDYIDKIKSVTIEAGVTSIGVTAFADCYALTSITIPDSVDTIGIQAFYGCSSLTSATIPDSVTTIKVQAFYGCSSLTKIIIPSSVTYIGEGAFVYCTDLNEMTIPNSVTYIGEGAFYGCSSLTSATIPDKVTSIEEWTFGYCTALNEMTIPNSVTYIGEFAFYSCTALKVINLPDSVERINEDAFEDCSSLESVTIPVSVTYIGDGAFAGCDNLGSINVAEGNQNYESAEGILFTKGKEALLQYPAGISRTSYEIPESVTSIKAEAFGGCSKLTSVNIPNNVTSIEAYVFVACTALKEITIPKSVTSIGKSAFEGCTALEKITIPNSVTTIKINAFADCNALKKVTLNSNCAISKFKNIFSNTKIEELIIGDDGEVHIDNDNDAFSNCSTLKKVTLGEDVDIDKDAGAFSSCENITDVTLNNNDVVSSFKNNFNSSKIEKVKIGEEVTRISKGAFANCDALNSVRIGGKVTKIEDQAFSNCSNLILATGGFGITDIGDGAFEHCISLVFIPSLAINSIGDGAFADCTQMRAFNFNTEKYKSDNGVLFEKNGDTLTLKQYPAGRPDTSYTIPESVTNISSKAFEGCKFLTELTLPASVDYIGDKAFDGCSNLSKITVNSKEYKDIDGVLYSKDGAELIRCPEGKTGSLVLPDSVRSISPNAFSGCKKLSSVTINEGINTILNNTFNGCSNLSSVSIGSNVESIGESAFSGCVKLTEITIPIKVSTIGNYAFFNCSELKKVVIGSKQKKDKNYEKVGLASVGEGAFSDCVSLTEFEYYAKKKPGYGQNVKPFNGCTVFNDDKKEVWVPKCYEGINDFCGHKTNRKASMSLAEKLKIGGTIVGILGGTATVLGFIFVFPDKWNNFIDNYGCGCLKRCHIPITTADEEQSVSEIDSNVLDQQLVE